MKLTISGQPFSFEISASATLEQMLLALMGDYHENNRGSHLLIELEVGDLPECYTNIAPYPKCIGFFNNLAERVNKQWQSTVKDIPTVNYDIRPGLDLPDPKDIKLEVVYLSKIEDQKAISSKPLLQVLTKQWIGAEPFPGGGCLEVTFYSSKPLPC